MVDIRTFRDGDLESLYAICLATGDAGKDATALYADPKLIGHIYAAPYAVLSPETCFVAVDEAGVCGYAVGALDTRAFEARLEREWWPDLRRRYPDPSMVPEAERTADQKRAAMIHRPHAVPEPVIKAFPAHMHLNVLPRAQGQGAGRALCMRWLDMARRAGAKAVHVGVSPVNAGGQAFWRKCGFKPADVAGLPPEERAVWLGQRIDGPAA